MPVPASKIVQGANTKYCTVQMWNGLLSNSVYFIICLRKLPFTFGKEYCTLKIVLKCFLWRSKCEGKEKKICCCLWEFFSQPKPHWVTLWYRTPNKPATPGSRCLWLATIIKAWFCHPYGRDFHFPALSLIKTQITLLQDESEQQNMFQLFHFQMKSSWKDDKRRRSKCYHGEISNFSSLSN